jgi:YggT family protein
LSDLVCTLLTLYWALLFFRILLSWFPTTPGTPLASVNSAVYSLTEPVLGPVRRMIGPVRVGSIGLDLSATLVLIAWRIILMPLVGC